jgi:hypothetical protein
MAPKLALFDGVTEHDKGVDTLAEHRVWLRHDGDLDDGWMFEQNVFDLGGVDLEPAPVDHILDAIDDPQVLMIPRSSDFQYPATNPRSVAYVLLK